MTSHSSQGATVDQVFIHIDTSDSKSRALIDETLAYVATSRPRYDAQIFTDNEEQLATALSPARPRGRWRNTQRLLGTKGRTTYMYMNRVTLVGFTGAEAKHTSTQGGKAITRFSLATTKRYKSGNEWKDNTQWHDCVVYNTSVKAAESIQKGDHLLIEGELQYREYERTVETAEGPVNVQWPKTEIVVHSIVRLDRQPKQEKGAAA